jgi:hypothetical protein
MRRGFVCSGGSSGGSYGGGFEFLCFGFVSLFGFVLFPCFAFSSFYIVFGSGPWPAFLACYLVLLFEA